MRGPERRRRCKSPPSGAEGRPGSCLPEPQYGRTAIPPLRENERGTAALPVRIQVVPRKRFALSPHGDQGFFVPLTREKEVVYERVIVSLCQSHHL